MWKKNCKNLGLKSVNLIKNIKLMKFIKSVLLKAKEKETKTIFQNNNIIYKAF